MRPNALLFLLAGCVLVPPQTSACVNENVEVSDALTTWSGMCGEHAVALLYSPESTNAEGSLQLSIDTGVQNADTLDIDCDSHGMCNYVIALTPLCLDDGNAMTFDMTARVIDGQVSVAFPLDQTFPLSEVRLTVRHGDYACDEALLLSSYSAN